MQTRGLALFFSAVMSTAVLVGCGAEPASTQVRPDYDRETQPTAPVGILAIIALGMLSAFGVSALLRERWSHRRYLWLLAGAGVLFLAVLVWGLRVVPSVSLSSTSMRVAVALMAASLAAVSLLAWKRSMAAALVLVAH